MKLAEVDRQVLRKVIGLKQWRLRARQMVVHVKGPGGCLGIRCAGEQGDWLEKTVEHLAKWLPIKLVATSDRQVALLNAEQRKVYEILRGICQ